ncbi:hypothetical protein [Aeromicrobium sp. Sec7.5]|uniref:hypothetical protein n=1 Tax=Aeromicrobium sp. Sec7.5 TaxID=3121276 RepID=UPI002FE483F8
MGRSIRQQARSRALEAQDVRRRERAAGEKRRSALGIEAAVVLEERDELVRRLELTAGQAVLKLLRDERVPVAELADWIPDLSDGEARRLRALAETAERDLGAGPVAGP